MAKKVKDIQAVIEQRAANKLNKDMAEMCAQINRLPLLRNMHDGQRPEVFVKYPEQGTTPEKMLGFNIPQLFNGEINREGNFSGSLWIKNLREYWLTEYIQRETQEFFERLDRLESDVTDLMSAKPTQDDY